MADLSPRGRYRDRIKRCDLLADLPQDDAGYIIMDPPYFGAATEQYSTNENDISNMEQDDWNDAMAAVAAQCRKMQAAADSSPEQPRAAEADASRGDRRGRHARSGVSPPG